jgi:hypothetical protein
MSAFLSNTLFKLGAILVAIKILCIGFGFCRITNGHTPAQESAVVVPL